MIPWWLDRPVAVEPVGPEAAGTISMLQSASFPLPWSPADCEALLADRQVIGLLAVERGWRSLRSVGFVLARAAGGEAEILSVGVAPGARARGIGRRLMQEIISHLPYRGATVLFLEVEEGNVPALRLYRGLGFRQVGRREAYYARRDAPPAAALVLRRDL